MKGISSSIEIFPCFFACTSTEECPEKPERVKRKENNCWSFIVVDGAIVDEKKKVLRKVDQRANVMIRFD